MSDTPYYPQKRYVEKGLAPETALNSADFIEVSMAARRAVENGVLTPELAKYMVPMAMVEGWSGNYGIRGDMALYASKENIDRFQRMGITVRDESEEKDLPVPEHREPTLTPASLTQKIRGKMQKPIVLFLDGLTRGTRKPGTPTPAEQEWDKFVAMHRADEDPAKIAEQETKFIQIRDGDRNAMHRMPQAQYPDFHSAEVVIQKRGKDKFLVLGGNGNGGGHMARVMAAILAEKASHKDIKSPEDAVKRYNGRGKATEYIDDVPVPADVDVYLKKVMEAREMLNHPLNAPVRELTKGIGVD